MTVGDPRSTHVRILADIPVPAARRETVYEVESIQPRCPVCAYDLRATVTVTGATCSECGARLPFDDLAFPSRSFFGPVARVASGIAWFLGAAPWRAVRQYLAMTAGIAFLAWVATPAELMVVLAFVLFLAIAYASWRAARRAQRKRTPPTTESTSPPRQSVTTPAVRADSHAVVR